jgi:nitrite reductase/ring-hydroxylating ferredoxin subunit
MLAHMLTPADNERLTRVGPGTPMGNLYRRYWIPAALSDELPEADGDPVRVRLLGENLVAFRDTSGAVGLIEDACPHRRAPMFYGRNEAHGMRCVYHGWKFDRHGVCTEMPSEPPDSLFKTKVTIAAYPTHEAGGIVWTYMGPSEAMPAVPDYELLRAPATHRFVSKTFEECNWLQALEGGIDTAHSSFAHNLDITDMGYLRNRSTAPRLEVEKTAYGFRYAGLRDLAGACYARVYHYVMPAMQIRGRVAGRKGGVDPVPTINGHIWVPIDDETSYVYNWMYSYTAAIPITPAYAAWFESAYGRGADDLLPGYKLKKNMRNDYLIDRDLQRRQVYTGIVGINTQDFALQEGMGPIVDRSREHLGTSDRAIIAARQLLLEATHAVENGAAPRGVDPAASRSIRAVDYEIAKDADWREALRDELVAKF